MMSVSLFSRYPHLHAIGKLLSPPRYSGTSGARRVVQMRDDFLDAASHELKTPLTSLRLQVQLISKLAEAGEGKVPLEKIQTLASNSDREITRLTTLINSLLEVSEIRTGKLELKLEEFDLAEAVREELSVFKADPSFAQLDVQVNAPQPIHGSWDRLKIAQVLHTLLSNAAQYGLRRPIEVSVWANRSRARVSVHDQGIGISSDDQERIFGQFERGVPGTKYNGLGLGLFIARQIALAHRGDLKVHSKLGEGSVFTLKLPLPATRRMHLVGALGTTAA